MSEISIRTALDAACRESLSAFTQKAFSVLEGSGKYEHNWHIDCISEHLEAARRGEIRRLAINMPPRSLKTHTVSVSFPAWVLGKNPRTKFILTSFRHALAEDMTRRSKILIKSDWYANLFPSVRIAKDQDQKHVFETDVGGRYLSSAMQSVTGSGADFVLIDDPLNPHEAASDTIRNSTNRIIRETLFSRFNDPRTGVMVLVMQRLHDDDCTGNLLRDGGWHHLKLPAEAINKSYHIMLGEKKWTLEEGGLLFPQRLTRDVLKEQRDALMEYGYAGQYLQEPVPLGGGEIKDNWVQYYDVGRANARNMNIYILCDAAGGDETNKKKKKNSDFTAMMVIGLAPDNNYYLLDAVRDRLNPTERIDTLFLLHRKWNELTGKPPKVGYEKYGLMTDTHYIHKKQNEENYRFQVVELGGTMMSKEDRIRRMIPDLERGRWYLPSQLLYIDTEDRQWNLTHEIVSSEMGTFPRSRYDDMIDAISRIYDVNMTATFPTIKTTSRQAPRQPQSWMDF